MSTCCDDLVDAGRQAWGRGSTPLSTERWKDPVEQQGATVWAMPSYRCEVEIRRLRPGVAPQEVLPEAERLLARHHRVEGRSVELVGDRPQIRLRFLIDPSHDTAENEAARTAVLRLIQDLQPTAECSRWVLKRGPGNAWHPVASGECAPTPGS